MINFVGCANTTIHTNDVGCAPLIGDVVTLSQDGVDRQYRVVDRHWIYDKHGILKEIQVVCHNT